tara:strand:+ start:342 stop:632 length:291 start_codon:yes stop_codon:yes gene_type:complete
MSSAVKTFKQPYLDKIEDALDKAVSITWEGCHKIYIALDAKSHDAFIEYGYDMVAVEDKAEAVSQLWEWWDASCGLRFINAVEDDDTFHDVIGQCE